MFKVAMFFVFFSYVGPKSGPRPPTYGPRAAQEWPKTAHTGAKSDPRLPTCPKSGVRPLKTVNIGPKSGPRPPTWVLSPPELCSF